jgi:hypothetical protein
MGICGLHAALCGYGGVLTDCDYSVKWENSQIVIATLDPVHMPCGSMKRQEKPYGFGVLLSKCAQPRMMSDAITAQSIHEFSE